MSVMQKKYTKGVFFQNESKVYPQMVLQKISISSSHVTSTRTQRGAAYDAPEAAAAYIIIAIMIFGSKPMVAHCACISANGGGRMPCEAEAWAWAGAEARVGVGMTFVPSSEALLLMFFLCSSIGTSNRACTERARERNTCHDSPPNTVGAPFTSQ